MFSDYVEEATRLREKYTNVIKILIGVEIDWIRPSSLPWINECLHLYEFDLFVGSVHHVHTIPIDYERRMYEEARSYSGGTDEGLFKDYFDLQYAMLQALKPPLVGHFDLIRLLSDDPDADFLQWPGVLEKVTRNLDFIADYGGVMELNSASLRKGMKEPYPIKAICKVSSACGLRRLSLALIFSKQQSYFLPREVNLLFRTIAIMLDKSGQITLNCYSSLPRLVLRRCNVLEREKVRKTSGFQTSFLARLASMTTFEAIGSSDNASWISKGSCSPSPEHWTLEHALITRDGF